MYFFLGNLCICVLIVGVFAELLDRILVLEYADKKVHYIFLHSLLPSQRSVCGESRDEILIFVARRTLTVHSPQKLNHFC